MDEFLAQLYNTRETIGAEAPDTSDLDKLAEAQILDDMFKAEGIDVDKITDETILKLAHEIFGDESALVKQAAEGTCAKCGKKDCGCGCGGDASKCKCPKGGEGKAPPFVEKEAAAPAPAANPEGEETFEEKFAQADKLGRVMAHAFVQEKSEIEKKAMEGMDYCPKCKNAKADCKCPKDKEASAPAAQAPALDILAEKRALDILKEAGITPGEQQQPEQATEEEKLAAAVEKRAHEMLVEAGYVKE